MGRVIQVTSGPEFRGKLRDYPTVFAMFYLSDHISTRAMLPIYESLCDEHSSPSVTFVKVEKEDLPGLCVEHGVPRDTSLTFVAFKDNCKKELIDGENSKVLEQFVKNNLSSAQSNSPAVANPQCLCSCHRQARQRRSLSNSPERVPIRRSVDPGPPLTRRYRMPLHVASTRSHTQSRNYSYPAEIRCVYQRGPWLVERPAFVFYRGQGGRYLPADDVRIQQGEDGLPQATYLDQSGPIAVERTLGDD